MLRRAWKRFADALANHVSLSHGAESETPCVTFHVAPQMPIAFWGGHTFSSISFAIGGTVD
jgi:hypothetical protein